MSPILEIYDDLLCRECSEPLPPSPPLHIHNIHPPHPRHIHHIHPSPHHVTYNLVHPLHTHNIHPLHHITEHPLATIPLTEHSTHPHTTPHHTLSVVPHAGHPSSDLVIALIPAFLLSCPATPMHGWQLTDFFYTQLYYVSAGVYKRLCVGEEEGEGGELKRFVPIFV